MHDSPKNNKRPVHTILITPMFEKQHEDDTYFDRLGSARKNHFGKFLMFVVAVLAVVFAFFYFNFTAMGLATGATKSVVPYGLGYTFLQPFYSIWALYYVLLGSKK